MNDKEIQLARLLEAGIVLSAQEAEEYYRMDAVGPKVEKGAELVAGFKRCGKCGVSKKFYLYNKNSASKTNTSGSCKDCQRESAGKSYDKTKGSRNYKAYYRQNKERKKEQSKKYYQNNKERLKEKHAEYLKTRKGRSVMRKAHSKRRAVLAANQGVPYSRELVIERDGLFLGLAKPICYLCNLPIEDTSGDSLHIDHVIPIAESGFDCFTNVASTHKICNLQREKDASNLTVDQVEGIMNRAVLFVDTFPEKFE